VNSLTRGIRNAFRNSIRTLSIVIILGLSVGLALAMLVARQAVSQKIDSVKSSTGNTISIAPAGFRGFNGGGNPLTDSQLTAVKKLPHVSSVSESLSDRLTSSTTNLVSSIDPGALGKRFGGGGGNGGGVFGGDFAGGDTSFTLPVSVTGTTDPSDLSSSGGGTLTLKSGKLFNASSTDNVALVGQSLAKKNNLSTGSTFSAYGSTITVVGIFDAGNTFSNSQLIMPLSTLQTLSAQPNDITSAVVTIDSISNLNSVDSAIKNSLGSAADVTSSTDRISQIVTPLENVRTISLYSLVGAVVAGAVIILLTMIMIVRERRREIGVLKAIGGSNLRIMFQFMAEAVTFTLLGAILGIGLGVVAGNPITKLLVNNSSNTSSAAPGGAVVAGGRGLGGRAFRSLGLGNNNLRAIHAAVSWTILLYGLAAALVIAIVGSSIASLLIAKVRPAEVMRTE